MKIGQFRLFFLLLTIALFITSCSSGDNEESAINKKEDIARSTKTTSEKDGFTINVTNNGFSISDALVQEFIGIFHQVYPKMVADYNSNAAKSIDVIIDTTYDGVAYAEVDKSKIVISSNYIKEKPNDTDLFTHELMHIVQAYPYGGPWWLIEGIADYARFVYGVDNAKAGWSLPSYSVGQDYANGYGVTASFLKWVKENYDNDVIAKLDSILRNGTYTYASWVEYTEFTLADLWLVYSGKPVGDIDLTIESTLKVSKENIDGPDAFEGSLKVVDGDTASKYLVFDYPTDLWIQQELSENAVVNKYTLTSGNDVPERDPRNWTFSGSNDEETWVDLDSRSNETFNGRNITKEYTFDSNTPYKHYRISITTNNGASIFQLSEWRLYQLRE
ncbi:basic secretory protein-like protein [Flagellimonas pacifica]|uniref:F5/8 type C domain-containing protein n=1 Tax=Flagellimonas pacifica TaxID=1247520 RepID=A0A285MFJ2_9FLAO|nr:basic secretory protein-like protein [Allomuricauda parva]SNY95493.1 F5/8 type C domain-containing protein [Allomuricauda parva]